MRDPHVTAAKLPHELHVVIAGHAQRCARRAHVHDETQHLWSLRSAVDEIAQEHGLAAGRSRNKESCATVCGRLASNHVAESKEQLAHLVKAPVDVADDVEWTGIVAPVVPQFLTNQD